MGEHVVVRDGVELWSAAHGRPDAEPLLLIMGANASAMGWPQAVVDRLAAHHRVVVYDHRDTGRSTRIDPGVAAYDVGDLTDDAVAVLDAHGIDAAHVVGLSLGGFVAQVLAVRYPGRVRTLTLALTGALDVDLPEGVEQPDAARIEALIALAEPADDLSAELDRRVALWRVLHGPVLPFDAAEYRAFEQRVIDHQGDHVPPTGHIRLGELPLPYGPDELRRLSVPTLVIEGTEDPFFPPGHGARIASLIPGARRQTFDGLGHALPATVHEDVVDAVLGHARGQGARSG